MKEDTNATGQTVPLDSLVLQKSAIAKFGMEVQIQHAIEELTELSLEMQKALRWAREDGELTATMEMVNEFCDGRNALKTIELFLLEHYDEERLERSQRNKDAKFARLIEETVLRQNDQAQFREERA